jgi:glucose/mannose-6-phosphate isomerase
MGGSAIGGDFVRQIARGRSTAAVDVVRDDHLPRVDPGDSFVFFVSYSGDTEETLTCWDAAGREGLRRAAITSGGELGRRARAESVPCLEIPGGSPPRAALGWTAVPLLVSLERGGIVDISDGEWLEMFDACATVVERGRSSTPESRALDAWARATSGRIAFVYAAADPTGPAALRWACQINENAKALAHFALFPEQNHNEIVGWEHAASLADRISVAVLEDEGASPRTRQRMTLVADQIESTGVPVFRFRPVGTALLARIFSLAQLGDLASLALARERGVDPTPVASIDRLKMALSSGTLGRSTP